MINYEYLSYWKETVEEINLLNNLIKDNIEDYQRTQDIEYLKCIMNSVKEIQRLIPLKKEYYNKTFNE